VVTDGARRRGVRHRVADQFFYVAKGEHLMIHQSPSQRRPMAVKVSTTINPRGRPVLQLRWSWLLLAALVILAVLFVAAHVVVR